MRQCKRTYIPPPGLRTFDLEGGARDTREHFNPAGLGALTDSGVFRVSGKESRSSRMKWVGDYVVPRLENTGLFGGGAASMGHAALCFG